MTAFALPVRCGLHADDCPCVPTVSKCFVPRPLDVPTLIKYRMREQGQGLGGSR